MRVTQSNGNGKNGIIGSRVTITTDKGEIVDRFTIPTRNARNYIDAHPNSNYTERYNAAVDVAKLKDLYTGDTK
jgi:hypothetical protein